MVTWKKPAQQQSAVCFSVSDKSISRRDYFLIGCFVKDIVDLTAAAGNWEDRIITTKEGGVADKKINDYERE